MPMSINITANQVASFFAAIATTALIFLVAL